MPKVFEANTREDTRESLSACECECNVCEMASKSILSYYKKKSEQTVNTVNNDVVDSTVNKTVNIDAKETNNNQIFDKGTANEIRRNTNLPTNRYCPPKDFLFPKTTFGTRNRSCQHKWFETYPWLHYDIKQDCVFCFYCMKHESKLSAEKNKEPAYISTGFKNWKKAPDCFKDHQNSKCHKGACTFEIIVPSCKDPITMLNSQVEKSRIEERQYLKTIMECIQYLARQGLPLRGSDHIDDNLTQLLLLRGKDNPALSERIAINSTTNKRKFTHQDYQNELLTLMANEVLRKKLNQIKQSRFFSTICDEYTDVSNKEQLSFCVRWVDRNLCGNEDFLGYYEIPNIKSDTIVNAIKDSMIRFELPMQCLRGQTYDGASNMMGKKSGVAQQILKDQPKALVTHCHGHSLSLSVKDANKLCRILSETMGTVGEIIILIKFSPKRERMLGDINDNIEVSNDGDGESLEHTTSLSKLSVTRWTIRANAYSKVYLTIIFFINFFYIKLFPTSKCIM